MYNISHVTFFFAKSFSRKMFLVMHPLKDWNIYTSLCTLFDDLNQISFWDFRGFNPINFGIPIYNLQMVVHIKKAPKNT